MAVATVQDVTTAIGRPITDQAEVDRVTYWLSAAEMQIRARLGDVALLDQDAVRYVEAEAVATRLSNPDGYQSESIDDYTYRLPAESRQITITSDHWALLNPVRAGSFYSASVVSPIDLP